MPQSTFPILLRFLGSMNLAITLLVAIAVAAVIGTVVQQNQPYPDYVLKFGPFWFEVFKSLDLYNVYSSAWFLSILGFLVLSTSVCVYRNLPHVLRDLNDYREHSQRSALSRLPHQHTFANELDTQANLARIAALLQRHHYRFRHNDAQTGLLIAAKKGSGGRLGYIFSHVAIIVICVGGLMDGNLPLKIAEWRGEIAVETRRIPAGEIPPISTLSAENSSFRANIDIAEGGQSNLAFIDYKDGYLLQKLPFTLQVDDFRIEHYPSGQPKSFESDLTVIAPSLPRPLKQTISVNHPLTFKGYTIYQNSFGDGGSKLHLRTWPLYSAANPGRLTATVKQFTQLDDHQLEISDFRPFNVNPDPSGEKKFINLGPSFQYKLRQADGTANEYLTYMQPIEQEGRWFYLSGMRGKVSEQFNYWFLPADREKRPARFMAFYHSLRNPEILHAIAMQTAASSDSGKQSSNDDRQKVARFMQSLAEQFIEGGQEKITAMLEQSVAPEKRPEASAVYSAVYSAVLQRLLKNVYLQVLRQERIDVNQPMSDFDSQFLLDALAAVNLAHVYAAPVFLELESFQHIEATGLQITRSPGQWLVFPGCLLLVLGVFCMFYLPQRRLWILLENTASGSVLLLAGSAQRNRYDFDREFELIKQQLTQPTTSVL
ncbi:cytochrome c biogenesis protein ResB [Methylomonas sp. SURF-2]|uniref:Cytochrome c biogenesis protein ResB n=1 Tax=Methylomonas subterranea TaxID=2952225 RepID=A0ABT1TGC4_9GAMM|nr:cytochrome c biogenesis protein ResB [Methylomonas sp. SURF-2]MCQ8104510.1 cytochrome c biogenesis protein ResB [Methylomonas sp. SURF-2]